MGVVFNKIVFNYDFLRNNKKLKINKIKKCIFAGQKTKQHKLLLGMMLI